MLSIIIREKVEGSEYKYLIKKGMYAYTAFHTEKGFNQFLEIANIKLNEPRIIESEKHGKLYSYLIDSEIDEILFWELEEVPKEAKKFKGLSNGSYVDCYYIHTENGAKIFRPNPNAKEVYKPLSLDEHIKYSKING